MKYKKIFIACPISKYLTEDGIYKEFEIFIKNIYDFCQDISAITFLALDREEYGKKKMYGSDCTTADFNEIQNTDLLIAFPEDSMGVSVELGWASALGIETIVFIDKKYKGDIERFLDDIFAKSIFASRENYNKFLKRPTAKALLNDPMILFAQSVENERENLSNSLKSYDAAYNRAHRTYVKGLLEMEKDKKHWPDANFTLRLTYGQVKGYHPRDCVYYTHQTTLDGVMEKEDSTNWEFVVPQKLKDLYRAKDFGRYATKDGRMPVAFCATTHTTGGNSGSPVMNANGELIGINFDRNWEGVGGDIEYLPDYQRSIIVDIRYVLFLIEKYGRAEGLLQEMEIIE